MNHRSFQSLIARMIRIRLSGKSKLLWRQIRDRPSFKDTLIKLTPCACSKGQHGKVLIFLSRCTTTTIPKWTREATTHTTVPRLVAAIFPITAALASQGVWTSWQRADPAKASSLEDRTWCQTLKASTRLTTRAAKSGALGPTVPINTRIPTLISRLSPARTPSVRQTRAMRMPSSSQSEASGSQMGFLAGLTWASPAKRSPSSSWSTASKRSSTSMRIDVKRMKSKQHPT